MTLLDTPTLAERRAAVNLRTNLAALARSQPDLVPWIADQHLGVEWVFARDGTLSALEESDQWWSGCSLPARVADKILSRLEVRGAVGCFLMPPHAAHIRKALEMLRPEQALVAIVPEMRDLSMTLHCEDFSAEFAAHRLWFAGGAAWEVGLKRVFDDHPGLATPTSFVRTPDADSDAVDAMVATAQQVIGEITACRAAAIQELRQTARSKRPMTLCVLAPSRFRLWNDIGDMMLGIFSGADEIPIRHFDADDPLNSSPLALAEAIRDCGALFTANTARGDLPCLLPEAAPWITWLTTARIPAASLATPEDRLIVVEPALRQAAIRAGWQAARVHVGGWPDRAVQTVVTGAVIALIADTCSLDTPKDLIEYSSHSVLWEAIREELLRQPFALKDVNAYLKERMERLGVGEEAFARSRFIDKLIMPAYQQGVARALIGQGLPLRLYGAGWEALPESKPFAAGAVHSREHFNRALSESSALIHAWPAGLPHPIESSGLPLIRTWGRDLQTVVREALSMPHSTPSKSNRGSAPLSADFLQQILKSLQF